MKASILDDMGFADEAIAAYRKIIEIKPDSMLAHLNLGITLLRKEDHEQAYSEIMQAHEIAPDHPSPFMQLAKLARSKGEAYEEERYLNEFVRVGKGDPRLPMVQERLKQLKTQNVTVAVPGKNDPASAARTTVGLMEAMTRALWCGEKHRKTFSDAKTYSPRMDPLFFCQGTMAL